MTSRVVNAGPATAAIAFRALFLIVCVLALPAQAAAHSSFLESSPKPGAQLAQAPEEFTLEFTEPLQRKLTTATLHDVGSGNPVAVELRVVDGRTLQLRPRQRLRQSAYRIDWHSVSTVDGHVKEGAVGFGVGTAALSGLELDESPFADGRWTRIPVRAAFYVALFFFAGGVLGGAIVRRPAREGHWLVPPEADQALREGGVGPESLVRRARSLTRRAGLVAVVGAIGVAVVDAADAAGTLAPGDLGAFLTESDAGLGRLLTVAALLAAVPLAGRRPRPAAVLAALALLGIAASGHASSADQRVLAIATDWAHLLAGAVWIGGLGQVAALWLPAVRGAPRLLRLGVLRAVLPAFGRVALPAFLVVATTGLVNAIIQLGEPAALWQSDYGRVLAGKVALVFAIAAASWVHVYRLRPRLLAAGARGDTRRERIHWRLIGSEPALAAVVLLAAALLVAFPLPPGQAGEPQASVEACDPCPFAKPAARELAVAAPAGSLTVAAWLRMRRGEVAGTVRLIDAHREPAAGSVAVARARRLAPCGTGCWKVRLPRHERTLAVAVRARGENARVALPARWMAGSNGRARALLAGAERAMRALGTLRQTEIVQSAPGGRGKTEFRFRSPDRMAYAAKRSASVVIADRQWVRTPGFPWQEQPAPSTLPVRPGKRFRWSVFLPSARLLGVEREDGREVAQVAFFDYGYPVWYTMTIERRTRRVRAARLVTPANRIEHRYRRFNRPLAITPPAGL